MKIKVKRAFRYQATPSQTLEVAPGIYSVPGDIAAELAEKILKFGKAEILAAEKKAPENKVRGDSPESKTGVARKKGRRRRTGAESDG